MEEQEKEQKEPAEQTEHAEQEPISIKEERIRKIAYFYYSRPDVRKAMFEFSKNRECVPRYFEGFGKRPDVFHYDSDILGFAKSGATSFHCSEELWNDPLNLSTESTPEEQKKIRTGWDLLIDVDSKYLDYSKIYAEVLIDVLRSVGIKNIGIKFSGSRGFHFIIPWKAFPEEIPGIKTKDMFPEWPRLICQYLNSRISEKLKNRVLDIQETGETNPDLLEKYCKNCNNNNIENKAKIFFICASCKTQMQNNQDTFERKRKIRCPNCQREMEELKKEEFLFCPACKIDSIKNSSNFKERVKSKHIDADIVLVSPRHLFRMPYSLHEKTSMASIVLNPDKIKDFNLKDADPLKVKPINFIPDSQPGEANMLLRAALEFRPPEENKDKQKFSYATTNPKGKKYDDSPIRNLNSSMYPPTIKKILDGMKEDGRKRALFILLSFFTSLKLSPEQIQKEIEDWNKKNYNPLQPTYIKGQLMWYFKQKESKLPPNFDKSYYKDIGIIPTEDEIKLKNPVNYTKRKAFGFSPGYQKNNRAPHPKKRNL